MGLIAHYLRVLFRSHTRPINKRIARKGELISSVVYLLSAWSAFGYLIYYVSEHAAEFTDSSAQAYTAYDAARKFGSDKPSTVIHIKGFSVEKEVLDRDDPKLLPSLKD